MPSARNVALGLLILAGAINFIDRSAVSLALPAIKTELHLSDGQAGLLLSAFAWSYAAAQLPAGTVVDRLGARWALAVGLAAWSCVQAASGLARGLPGFIAARVALGLGESPMFLGGARVVADHFPPAERAGPIGLLNASAALGPAIAPLVLTPLMALFGWRAAFVAMGAAGLAVAAVWARIYRDPARAAGTLLRPASPVVWFSLLRQRSMLGLLLGFAGPIYLSWLFVTWLPDYLVQVWGMTPNAAAYWSAVPQVFGFFGSLGGGFLSDRVALRLGARQGHQLLLVVGLLVAGLGAALAAAAPGVGWALAAICLAQFAANLSTTSGWALAASLAPVTLVATVEAAANIGASIGGSLAPLVTGYVVQATGSFTPALLIACAVAVVTAGAHWRLTRGPILAQA